MMQLKTSSSMSTLKKSSLFHHSSKLLTLSSTSTFYKKLNNTNKINIISKRNESSLDPEFYLHRETVLRDQQYAFREAWENNCKEWKKQLTEEEYKLFEEKIQQSGDFENFEKQLKGLFGLQRHTYIRKTKTWNFVNECVLSWLDEKKNNPSSLIFGNDSEFNEFRKNKLAKHCSYYLLKDFDDSDLRYMIACMVIDYCKGPLITCSFGNRNNYHYRYPDPTEGSATWINTIYDRVNEQELILLTCINCIKENKPISQEYFKEKLESSQQNAIQSGEWKPYVQKILELSEEDFNDLFDRAFNAFQTDEGVSPLKTRFESDLV